MVQVKALRASLIENATVRRWISRAFIVSILVYLVIIGYLIAEAVMGASKWAPYHVSLPTFIALTIASEIAIAVTAVWIFKDDVGIWPRSVSEGWANVQNGHIAQGLKQMFVGAWDVSIIDLRLRTPQAILLGRLNRVAALVPLAYALVASRGGAPWGLRSSALVDVGITLVVWVFMEAVMVRPEATPAKARAFRNGTGDVPVTVAQPATARVEGKTSYYEVRPVRLEDLDRIEEIERIKWREQAATREMILARLNSFPEGQFAAIHCASLNGNGQLRRTLVAWSTVMPANEHDISSFGSWDRVTSNGTIRGLDRNGNVLVGVNLTSVTEGATYIVLGEILASVIGWGKKKLIGGSRLNGFTAFNDRRASEGKPPCTADQYARLREIRGYRFNEERLDGGSRPLSDDGYVQFVARLRQERGEPPLSDDDLPDHVCSNVRGYMSIPGARMVRVIEDYFSDEASANYGVLIEWPNPIPTPVRQFPWLKTWLSGRIRREVQAEWEARQQRAHERSRRRREERTPVPAFLRRDGQVEPVPEAAPSIAVEVAPGDQESTSQVPRR